ncbi:hypothetical protein K461DRAFT_282416 [Myriangium duriaei CBS 260.36]|uniref:Uncharacterized protein n=1 Tax=Myriangium duriaei CBS 260.36 TaxID=1168546 RepID=A0A9P4IUX7_9PEZI|nr:hypothetical protein K461DRAFT_282416 [Myriangium duriaei CBS 260.36]
MPQHRPPPGPFAAASSTVCSTHPLFVLLPMRKYEQQHHHHSPRDSNLASTATFRSSVRLPTRI